MRLGNGLGIRAVRACLPVTVETAQDALTRGRISNEDLTNTGVTEVPVSGTDSAPDMAVEAARDALAAAGWDGAGLGFTAHAWIHHQGHDFWSPAHYVAHRLGAERGVPLGIQVMCNGGGTALEAAASRLLADPSTGTALVTTGDRFPDEGFDRWAGDYGVFYGDGATAVLLHERDDAVDEFTLLGLSSAAVSAAEGLHRGRDEFTPATRWISDRIDVKRTKKAFINDVGLDGFYGGVHAALRGIVTTALEEAGIDVDDSRIRVLALPRVGIKVRRETYHPAVEGLTKARVVELGNRTGHLGAGDMAANLADIREQELLAPGEIALTISAGGGFGFTCAVVARPVG
ncbi:3-oxoacyl-[acyl-carrier-protein] synthase III C-terminal domain-containing protein [Streptomyces sp.]|uniref:3-oxoacyl-[acyl-carrier-protein] synthase III C-terminal domain-containing protein n=1 Tax=Streptomyces sp. TaxID=1931 RepID=UPI002D76F5B9|nr:3-oxoacyl-[acyl-carrier-protein] synthase III C-terminal domain-containing protein [Streptomyces sp.]HET6358922.1 3-oxoacyl-[acyl-carrier-protein] synthase III C-terminal domain-containing protein [Streptomyces sp.]